MENVTREIITDLYPLYVSGDASPDTRKLVEAFLREEPEFALTLAQGAQDPLATCAPPSLPPNHELQTLARLKRRLSVHPWLLTFAMIWSGMAFGRIVSDTSFDVSPRNFIVTAVIAACFWVAFFISLFRGRRAILVRLR
jgi:hypothetical protein